VRQVALALNAGFAPFVADSSNTGKRSGFMKRQRFAPEESSVN
jgi:hypothetical protein